LAGLGAGLFGAFLPLTAVVFYLALSVFFVVDPLRHMGIPAYRPAGSNVGAGG
jgi:hypothetical protein